MKLSKSKLALAKVINENGGWVDGANFSSQDYDGWVYHFRTKPTIDRGSEVWNHKGCIGEGHFKAGKINNWHQTIISREEYYQAYPKADADGWIEWNADGKSDGPIGNDVPVDVKLRCGSEHFGQLLSSDSWMDLWGGESIVAYRLHRPDVKPEFCESVTRGIQEPESKPTIEQLAQDYRNAKDYAERLKSEATDAMMKAESIRIEAMKRILELTDSLK